MIVRPKRHSRSGKAPTSAKELSPGVWGGGGGGVGVHTILVIGDWPVLFLVKRELAIFKNREL